MRRYHKYQIRAASLLAAFVFTAFVGSPAILADSGYTWADQTNAGTQPWSGVASSSTGQYLAATVTGGDIYTSNDYGVTWVDDTVATPEANSLWQGITSSASGQYLAAVDYSGDIFTSNDYGESWTDQTNSGNEPWYYITSSASGQYLAAVATYGGGIYRSNDYGVTWTQTTAPGENWVSISASSDGSTLVAAD